MTNHPESVSGNRHRHPTGEILKRFAQGRLGDSEMTVVERHLEGCEACCQSLQELPDDRLVGLLRRRDAVALVLAAVVLTGLGCSKEPKAVAIDATKARSSFNKRFQNPDGNTPPKGGSPKK
jgi:anti-sigma factor RsiW